MPTGLHEADLAEFGTRRKKDGPPDWVYSIGQSLASLARRVGSTSERSSLGSVRLHALMLPRR